MGPSASLSFSAEHIKSLSYQIPVAVCVHEMLIEEAARVCLEHVEWVIPLCLVQERRGSVLRVDQETPDVAAAEHQVFITYLEAADAEFSASTENF